MIWQGMISVKPTIYCLRPTRCFLQKSNLWAVISWLNILDVMSSSSWLCHDFAASDRPLAASQVGCSAVSQVDAASASRKRILCLSNRIRLGYVIIWLCWKLEKTISWWLLTEPLADFYSFVYHARDDIVSEVQDWPYILCGFFS